MMENEQSIGICDLPTPKPAILVERFQDGEIDVFDDIVDRYKNYVYGLAYQFTHNPDDAYDISQEVFLKVFRSLDNLRSSSTFSTWLRRIIVNTSIDYIRKQPKEREFDDAYGLSYIVSEGVMPPDSYIYAKELQTQILGAIDKLPDKQKSVFILRYYDDLSLEEIAKTLGRSIGTVKAHLFYATKKLRKLVDSYVY